jgi:hypothetical protein
MENLLKNVKTALNARGIQGVEIRSLVAQFCRSGGGLLRTGGILLGCQRLFKQIFHIQGSVSVLAVFLHPPRNASVFRRY